MAQDNLHKKVTLKDIAAKTGYSVTAVSHALRDLSDISPAVKKKIRDCAEDMGYIQNAFASSLRTGMSKTIAVILGDFANPFFSFVAKEVEHTLRQYEYTTFLMSTNESHKDERSAIIAARNKNVDGIILCPSQSPYDTDNLDFIKSLHIPCVLIGRHFEDYPMNSVIMNDLNSGYLLGKHLINMGHREIIYLDTYYPTSSSKERYSGFMNAVSECGETVNIKKIYFETGGKPIDYILTNDGFTCTAVIAYNDIMAWNVINQLNERGLQIPNDLSLVSFDNLHSYLPLPFKLTSISAVKNAMPQNAARLLLNAMGNPQTPVSQIVLDVKIYDRGSVKKIN